MIRICKLTPFGLAVKHRLVDLNRTQTWLIRQIHQRTGMYVDGAYLYKIFTDQRSAPKIKAAIRDILSLPGETPEKGEDQ